MSPTSDEKIKLIQFDCLTEYPDVVPVLEDLLTLAKAGQAISFVGVLILKEGKCTMSYTSGVFDRLYLTLGTLEALKQEILYKGHEIAE